MYIAMTCTVHALYMNCTTVCLITLNTPLYTINDKDAINHFLEQANIIGMAASCCKFKAPQFICFFFSTDEKFFFILSWRVAR